MTMIMLAESSVKAEIETVRLPLEVHGRDVVSVSLPVVASGGESPFDFVMDPQMLIYQTDAAQYGGGTVEEGATLIFHNHDEGEYDFSSYSDRLMVRNQSNVPVVVTVTASISDFGKIELVDDPEFEENTNCSMYLALVDDEGNEQPVLKNGETSVSIELGQAPDRAYVYRLDEESGEYIYGLSADPEEIDFDTYSFGLVGACNPNGKWQEISAHPKIKVSWKVEPLVAEDGDTDEESEKGNSVDAGDPSENEEFTESENAESQDGEEQAEPEHTVRMEDEKQTEEGGAGNSEAGTEVNQEKAVIQEKDNEADKETSSDTARSESVEPEDPDGESGKQNEEGGDIEEVKPED